MFRENDLSDTFIGWNHVETISSTEDDALSSYSSINRPNQSGVAADIDTTIRRSLSTNNSETLRNEFEPTDENDNEIGSIRDDEATIPKRRQSRATSANNKVKERERECAWRIFIDF